MSKSIVSVLRYLAPALLFLSFLGTSSAATPARTPVIVELFTSEGCSSCPPADALLSKLREMGAVEGAEVFILGEHVDYWNSASWSDRFSSASLTQRQHDYVRRFDLDSSYTPQMVIDGKTELVGNTERRVRAELAQAAHSPKPTQVKLAWSNDGQLQVDIDGTAEAGAKVMLAITEDGLSTQVAGGENGGRVLQHNGVVRDLREIGSLKQGKFSEAVKAAHNPDWKAENLRAVVFVQRSGHREVLGASSLSYSTSTK